MKVALTMDEETARIVLDATEFYARTMCGQYDDIPMKVWDARQNHHIKQMGEERGRAKAESEIKGIRDARIVLKCARDIQFPECSDGSYYGLGYTRVTDTAFNIYMAIRYALAWNRFPESGRTIDFSSPLQEQCPIPRVEIDGKCYLEGNMDEHGKPVTSQEP